MKNSVKEMDCSNAGFRFLKGKFPNISKANKKANIIHWITNKETNE